MTIAQTVVWRLKSKQDRRFRTGHPWVYSNELMESPKGIEPGAPVELQDAGGKFLARGYGNPSSLIAFRALSRDPAEKDPLSPQGIHKRLLAARLLRERLGLMDQSHRLCFGEADGLPGLIIDRYLSVDRKAQVFSVQAHTAGMDRVLPTIIELLGQEFPGAAIVLRNDVGFRKLEGIEEEAPRIAGGSTGGDLRSFTALMGMGTQFRVDLIEGQKTGFFLDQAANVELAVARFIKPSRGPLRVLDLCCYVGQWSAQIARAARAAGRDVQITAVDASASALELARANIEAQGIGPERIEMLRGDVLKDLETLEGSSFDLVIADPPALVKGRKNIQVGTHAYLQLNTQVFRLAKPGAGVVTCSCSALLEEEVFLQTLSKAAFRNSTRISWIARGGQSPDHPILAEFPEGRYLKCWMGVIHG